MKKKLIKIIYNNKYKNLFSLLKNSTLLTMPSIIGILLALLAIPIHLQINGKADYGNYIFFHFIIFFGLLLNFGINKIVAIEIAKNKHTIKIIYQSIKLSIYLFLFIFFIGFLISFFLSNIVYLFSIILGLGIMVIYLTLEGILQGLKKFQSLSIVNFIFYTISLNIPSVSLLIKNNNFENLIIFSILIKIVAIFTSLFLVKDYLKNKKTKNYDILKVIKKHSKWYLLYNINTQIFDILDKYLIKIYISPAALALYSIPYQLAGKITIFSKSISAVLLPEISKSRLSGNNNFNQSIYFYTISVSIFLLITFPFLDNFLLLWLKDQYTKEILDLTKIFLIITWLSGISHILITYFEGKKKIKFNSLIELYLLFPFLISLIIVVFNFQNLIYISSILLIKEIILLILRTHKLKTKIKNVMSIYLIIVLVILNLIVNLSYETYYVYTFVILVFFSTFLILRKNKV